MRKFFTAILIVTSFYSFSQLSKKMGLTAGIDVYNVFENNETLPIFDVPVGISPKPSIYLGVNYTTPLISKRFKFIEEIGYSLGGYNSTFIQDFSKMKLVANDNLFCSPCTFNHNVNTTIELLTAKQFIGYEIIADPQKFGGLGIMVGFGPSLNLTLGNSISRDNINDGYLNYSNKLSKKFIWGESFISEFKFSKSTIRLNLNILNHKLEISNPNENEYTLGISYVYRIKN